MSNKRDPAGQFTPNIIKESIKAFGIVPISFGTLIDLGVNYVYTHCLIVNSLDEDIIIKFGSNEITFQAGKDMWFDGFKFNNIIEYKYKTSAPTAGSLQFICF
jgi:hypothetical protein